MEKEKSVTTIYLKPDIKNLIPKIAEKLHNEGYLGMYDSQGIPNKSGVITALLLIAGGKKNEIKRIVKDFE